MPTQADVQALQRTNDDITAVVKAEIARFWRSIDVSTPESARVALDAFLPELVRAYGDAAALVAADFYDELRDKAAAAGLFAASLAEPAPAEQVQRMTRWAVGPLAAQELISLTDDAEGPLVTVVPPDPDTALQRITSAALRMVLQPGRDTIADNVGRDPARPRWARVPVGKTCAFCSMLASRGAVYASEETARMRHYHDDCNCSAIPMWDGDDYPEGYDPDALYEQYASARSAAGTTSVKPLLSKLRDQTGLA